ncbi:D-glycerate dehydrogenase [Aquincola tertiaricarbonis]|uniref:D-glycerate dehydrogenase n=1 Tax=Aquincola tertiaricarbonis TaxID=391953 RepID=A0ABY4S131_AQUTE|nr:D-glycerate dehydrogenase [Aquincola tertiaricarbonis]URI05835.1 D-glycerate dehydrogenase [Aquincola tertiaricarbonis]
MITPRQQVLVFRELPPDQLARLQAAHEVTVANPRVAEQRDAFFEALPRAQGLIGSSYRIDAPLLAQAPALRVISSISVGIDNYELPALRERGVMLCHTPGVLTETTADTLFALIMATSRRLVELAALVREGRWHKNIDESLFGWDVHGKTLGIVGFGRIGQALARRAALGFGMPVLFHNRSAVNVNEELPALAGLARQVSLDELLAQADIVALTVPLTDETRGLMNAERFAAMKPGAMLVNGSRGGVVDEAALLASLDSGRLRGAGLDVFATEPLPLDSPLRTHPRVTPLPHIGSATHETRHAMAVLATSNLLQALAGQTPAATVR